MKIITFIQTTDGKINSNSLEALSAAQKLSSENNYILTFDKNAAKELCLYQSNGIE